MAVRRLTRGFAVLALLAAVTVASAPSFFTIRIRPGDTLTAIAARFHTTVAALVALNHLPGNGNLIFAGAPLKVPAPPVTHRAPARTPIATYVVRPGDTVSAIAVRFATTEGWIAGHNRLGPGYLILVGERLVVPAPTPPASSPGRSFAGRTYPPAVVAAANRDRATLARLPAPGAPQVRAMIVATARRYGLDPRLALAVADQESGFNQREVSPADAIGTMQVLPTTGAFVGRYLVHRPLNLFSASDNVTAGVVLLAVLTRAAPLPVAVAGYYQGLGSVRAHGMYADTKAYVANVLALRTRIGV